MCMNLLRRLAASQLPCSEADPAMVDRLRVLQAAGQIEARIPAAVARPGRDADGCTRHDAAMVIRITPRGWETLAAGAPAGEATRFIGTRHRSGA